MAEKKSSQTRSAKTAKSNHSGSQGTAKGRGTSSSAKRTTKQTQRTKAAAAQRQLEIEQEEARRAEKRFPYLKEILLLLTLAFCVVMFLGNLGIGGVLGSYLSLFSKGLAGKYLGNIFPILLFPIVGYIIYYWYETVCWVRISGTLLMLFSICGVCETASNTKETAAALRSFADSPDSAGGFFGILAAKLLIPAIGKPGTIILFVILLLIGFILLTGQSLKSLLEQLSDKAYRSAAEEKEYSRQAARERDERRQRRESAAARQYSAGSQRKLMSSLRISEEAAPAVPAGKKTRAPRQSSRPVQEPAEAPQAAETPLDYMGQRNVQYERPQTAQTRPLRGVTRNTKLIQDMPNDTEAKEMQLSDAAGTPEIKVVAKNGDGSRKAKRMSYDGGIEYGVDIFSDENMSKTDPDVVPPPVIKPQLKPKKDMRTLTELNQLDGGGTLSGINEIPIAGLQDGDYESASDAYARKNAIPGQIERAAWDTPLMPEEGDAAAQRTQARPIGQPNTEEAWKTPQFEYSSSEDDPERQTDVAAEEAEVQENAGVPEPEEVGYRTVTTASGKVIKARLNSVAGEKMLTPEELHDTAAQAEEEKIQLNVYEEPKEYVFPPVDLLVKGSSKRSKQSLDRELRETAAKLQQTLTTFGVGVTITNISCGPTVTRYELQPEMGVKVSKIVSLTDDIKLNLAAADIRMEAPIPGKAAIGIEVPNKENVTVMLRDLIETEDFKGSKSKVAFAVGKDIGGQNIVADIAKMPHLLIAGATGSGKSVSINTLIISILYKAKPSEVKLIMIDPKVVELSVYNGIPHLLIPVVTDPKKAAGALNWAVAEMEERYQKFAECGARDLKGYNERLDSAYAGKESEKPPHMAQIVIIVDELADLMMVAPGDVEDAIIRLAQKARAAGIHLVIATQRPSVNVITGLIKANVPSRIAFAVSSGVDSRTIIDMNGAEKLLGKGDMLFYPSGMQKPLRVQGAFVSDQEVSDIVAFLSEQKNVIGGKQEDIVLPETASGGASMTAGPGADGTGGLDDLFIQAGRFIIEKDKASIGMLQRMFRIGFNRAARIMDQLSDAGVVGEEEGTKPRKILMTAEEFENYIEQYL